jgi:hypothetical protein
MGYLGLIYETHRAFREPTSYVQMIFLFSLHDLDSPTIELGT